MNNSARQPWLSTAIFLGLLYFAVAVASSALPAAAGSSQKQFFWRLSAFVVSGIMFASHIAHEHFQLRNTAPSTAWHASVAAAFGGFALAVAANIHDLGSASGYRPKMLVALVAWPLLTGVPTFLVGVVMAAILGMMWRRSGQAHRSKRIATTQP